MIEVERTETASPVSLVVGTGTAGLTVLLRVRQGPSTTSYLDFSDNTFKTSGWTSQTTALADLGGGFYTLTGGLNIATMVSLATSTHHLALEFLISGAFSGSAIDNIFLRRESYDLSKSILQRPISDAEALPNSRSLGGAVQKLVNRVRVNGTNLEVYQADDATVSFQQALTANSAANPIVEADTV